MENNNQSMNTVVETFYVQETVNLIHDGEALNKWKERIAELGLQGQTEIVVGEKSPIPFLWMNQGLVKTFEILCPQKVKVEKYNKTPIPIELLDAVALCKTENYFDFVEVWYNDRDKDPVVIGYLVNEEYKNKKEEWYGRHYSDKYLIGRWADVKASLDTLIKRAMAIFKNDETIRLNQEIRERQRNLEDLDSSINRNFGSSMPVTDLPF